MAKVKNVKNERDAPLFTSKHLICITDIPNNTEVTLNLAAEP